MAPSRMALILALVFLGLLTVAAILELVVWT
jgi:hypothetical protein